MTKSIFYLFFFLMGMLFVFVPQDYNQPYFTLVPTHIEIPTHISVPKVDLKQITCLARNIYYEAGGESILGQAAVARVVLNRMNHGFARTACGVVYQSTGEDEDRVCQFSWVCSDVPEINRNHPAYRRAEKIARDVLVNNAYREVIPDTVLFFHSILIEPNWTYRQVKIIGNHLFYARSKIRPKPVDEPAPE